MKLRNKKTGEIATKIDVSQDFSGIWVLENKPRFYRTLAGLNEEWEDYTPPEPLIKDEKIRKAVRAWAEVNSIKKALYAERLNRSLCWLTDMGDEDFSIKLVGWIPTLKDDEDYTITELCGEE